MARVIVNGVEQEDMPTGEMLGPLLREARAETEAEARLTKSEKRHQSIYARWRRWFGTRAAKKWNVPVETFDSLIEWECYAAHLFQHRGEADFHFWFYERLTPTQRREICDQDRKPLDAED